MIAIWRGNYRGNSVRGIRRGRGENQHGAQNNIPVGNRGIATAGLNRDSQVLGSSNINNDVVQRDTTEVNPISPPGPPPLLPGKHTGPPSVYKSVPLIPDRS